MKLDEGEKEVKIPKKALVFVFAFIFLYLAISYFGAPTGLAVIASGGVIIGALIFFNQDLVKKSFKLYKEPKEPKPKVIEAEVVEQEVIE